MVSNGESGQHPTQPISNILDQTPSQNQRQLRSEISHSLTRQHSPCPTTQQEGKSNHVKAGNADDWLYHSFGTLAYTVEVGPSFSSQDNNEIGSVLLSNVMPAIVGTELALHITDLNCTPRELLCVPAISVVTIGVPLLAGSVFFGVRVVRRSRDRQNDPNYVGQSIRPTESDAGALNRF